MIGRILTVVLVGALGAMALGSTSLAGTKAETATEDLVLARDEDAAGVVATDDDDGDDTDDTDSFTSGVDSDDATNSRVTSVSLGDDRSRGDLTRDETKDGPGSSTRDRTANHTNDRSRNDTR
jgi:hypothetical protein